MAAPNGRKQNTQENWLIFKEILLNVKGKKKKSSTLLQEEVEGTSHWGNMDVQVCSVCLSFVAEKICSTHSTDVVYCYNYSNNSEWMQHKPRNSDPTSIGTPLHCCVCISPPLPTSQVTTITLPHTWECIFPCVHTLPLGTVSVPAQSIILNALPW